MNPKDTPKKESEVEESVLPLRRRHSGDNPLGALFLIGLGALLLLNNFDLLRVDVWLWLSRLWPLALLFIGLRHLAGSSRAGQFLVFLLALVTVLTFLFLAITGSADGLLNLLRTGRY